MTPPTVLVERTFLHALTTPDQESALPDHVNTMAGLEGNIASNALVVSGCNGTLLRELDG